MNGLFLNRMPEMDEPCIAETSRPGLSEPQRATPCERMNHPSAPNPEVISKPSTHLLDTIRATRESVGDGLNDDEFTRLLWQMVLPAEAGLAFLSFSNGFVTLTVPQQDLANWYPEKGWIAPEKERFARAIAEKYGLSLCEPPDQTPSFVFPRSNSPTIHHHLELANHVETIVVAHPQYLKIRLFGAAPTGRCVWNAQTALLLGPELLQDLSALYQA